MVREVGACLIGQTQTLAPAWSATDTESAFLDGVTVLRLTTARPPRFGTIATPRLRRTTAVRNGLFGTDDVVTQPAISTAVMASAANRAT